MNMENNEPLLQVKNLKTYFYTDDGVVKAVDGVDFHVMPGEVLGLVGESGCGKSVTSLSIMRLVDRPGRIIEGEIIFKGRDLLKVDESEMMNVRGKDISMIFHKELSKEVAHKTAVDLLRMVGIPDPEKKAGAYPHEVSGGQAQRVMIAMALALNPKLLIADEPTTALDVTIQAQILDLLRDLQNNMGTSVILITHDLGVIAEMADRVAVMYAGRIVEEADVQTLFEDRRHPYTMGLIASVPVLGEVKERLDTIPGNVPNLVDLPPGCRFASRCEAREKFGLQLCQQVEPDLISVSKGHLVRCWLYQDSPQHGHQAPMKEKMS